MAHIRELVQSGESLAPNLVLYGDNQPNRNIYPNIMEETCLIPGIVDDVVTEIFLHFAAIDWDGPFTLMLVSPGWRKIVLSRPLLWTWTMVDDSQSDWDIRIETAAYLSKDRPLQVILRTPFTSHPVTPHTLVALAPSLSSQGIKETFRGCRTPSPISKYSPGIGRPLKR